MGFFRNFTLRYYLLLLAGVTSVISLALLAFYLYAYRALETEAKSLIEEMLYYHRSQPNDFYIFKTRLRFQSGAMTFRMVEEQELNDYFKTHLDNAFKYRKGISPSLLNSESENYFYDNHFVGISLISPGLYLVASKANNINKLFIDLNYISLYLLLGIVLITLSLGYANNRRLLRRISYIDRAANDIIAGDLHRRVITDAKNTDAINDLSLTLNHMLNKIEQLVQEVKSTNNNIAHDLKSPLNRIRSRLEVLLLKERQPSEYQQAVEKSIGDIDQLTQTFNALLLLANIESQAGNYPQEPVNLSQIIDDMVEIYEEVAQAGHYQFDSHVQAGLWVKGNRNLLGQVVSNVLENAIKYGKNDSEGDSAKDTDIGQIAIKLSAFGDKVELLISDTGPGIPLAKRESVFERFCRLDSARSLPGSGLGLNLVGTILRLHQANITLSGNQPSGLCVRIQWNGFKVSELKR